MPKRNIYFKFEMLILSVLKDEDRYGYEITAIIKELSDGLIVIKEGTMYPTLYKLIDKDYISSRDVVVNKKVRVYYHLEDKGRVYLQTLEDEYFLWEEKIRKIVKRGFDNE